MKHLNFKIEKNETEVKTYIEFNSLVEFLTNESSKNMDFYFDWNETEADTEDEEKREECQKIADAYLERSCEIDRLTKRINKEFFEFIKKVKEDGFD